MRQMILAAVLAVFSVTVAFGQTVTYQGAEIQPGDVINFQGGVVTFGRFLGYGHSALYLGEDPQKHERVFLDFTATQYYFAGMEFDLGGRPKKAERAFVGRILPEREFLIASAVSHSAFDVFRLRDTSGIDSRRLLQEAKRLAIPDNRFGFDYVCSAAVAAVLSKATGNSEITAKTPDDFQRGLFMRHPQLTGKSINIQAVLRELGENNLSNEDFLGSIPPGSVDSREDVQAENNDYASWLHRLEAAVGRMEAADRQDKADRVFKKELVRRSYEFGYLAAAVELACSKPDALVAEVRQGRYGSVSMEREFLSAYLASVSDQSGLSPCQLDLLNKMNNSEAPVSWRDLHAWGGQYRATHRTVFQRIEGVVKRFHDALAEFNSRNSASSGPSSCGRERPSGGEGSDRHSPDILGTRSGRQLRGIAAGGWN